VQPALRRLLLGWRYLSLLEVISEVRKSRTGAEAFITRNSNSTYE
jgi:hypothetical protein